MDSAKSFHSAQANISCVQLTACPEQHRPTAASPGGTKAAPLFFWTEPENLMQQGCELQHLQGNKPTPEQVIKRDTVKRRGSQPPPAWPFSVSVTLGKHRQDVTMCWFWVHSRNPPAQRAQIPSQPCGFTGSAVLGCGEQGWLAGWPHRAPLCPAPAPVAPTALRPPTHRHRRVTVTGPAHSHASAQHRSWMCVPV